MEFLKIFVIILISIHGICSFIHLVEKMKVKNLALIILVIAFVLITIMSYALLVSK